jgi:retinol dehydrogenase-14
VTGGTSGIGAATAEALARDGWTVIAIGRDRDRGTSMVSRFRDATGNAAIDFIAADLSSRSGVRQAVEEFRSRYDALDVLINNVGGLFLNRRENCDGIELTFALNHLAPFLITNLLLDAMRRSESSRIINVSSVGHRLARGLRKDDLQWRRGLYRGFQAYHHSKLANLLFTFELARGLEGSRITVNAAGPGLTATNIGSDNRWYWRMLKPIADRVIRHRLVPAEQAAKTIVYLASSADVDSITGRYFVNETTELSSAASQDRDAAQWLWRISEELTGCRYNF